MITTKKWRSQPTPDCKSSGGCNAGNLSPWASFFSSLSVKVTKYWVGGLTPIAGWLLKLPWVWVQVVNVLFSIIAFSATSPFRDDPLSRWHKEQGEASAHHVLWGHCPSADLVENLASDRLPALCWIWSKHVLLLLSVLRMLVNATHHGWLLQNFHRISPKQLICSLV